jgi:hypothetical protein
VGNKPQKNKYGAFGYLTEALTKGKRRIRREYVAEMSAWLLMMGCQQERVAAGLAEKLVKGSLPGMRSTLAYCRQSIQTIEWLIHVLGQSFPEKMWDQAATVVAESLEIEIDTPPLVNPPLKNLTLDTHPEPDDGVA